MYKLKHDDSFFSNYEHYTFPFKNIHINTFFYKTSEIDMLRRSFSLNRWVNTNHTNCSSFYVIFITMLDLW